MANPEHLAILLQGVEKWNQWRKINPKIKPDFYEADLTSADLSGAQLHRAGFGAANLSEAKLNGANLGGAGFGGAQLSGADLSGADLTMTKFVKTNLIRANLTGADLSGADLSGANLTNSVLREAVLIGTVFRKAMLTFTVITVTDRREIAPDAINLSGADFNDARIGWTTFNDTDLSDVKGLDTVRHYGPSTIGIDTLYNSSGKIPEVFLRGCGVPDEFITFIPAHIGARQAIRLYSCFISYSTKDEEFAKRLYSRLQDEHVPVWCAFEDIKGGEKVYEQIERAIQLHDRLLVVLSANSLQSEWVMTEIREARKIEREEKRRKLFPIRLVDYDTLRKWKCFDADSGKDLAVEVREYFIPDFSNWKDHDSFEAAFDRLLRDLRAMEGK